MRATFRPPEQSPKDQWLSSCRQQSYRCPATTPLDRSNLIWAAQRPCARRDCSPQRTSSGKDSAVASTAAALRIVAQLGCYGHGFSLHAPRGVSGVSQPSVVTRSSAARKTGKFIGVLLRARRQDARLRRHLPRLGMSLVLLAATSAAPGGIANAQQQETFLSFVSQPGKYIGLGTITLNQHAAEQAKEVASRPKAAWWTAMPDRLGSCCGPSPVRGCIQCANLRLSAPFAIIDPRDAQLHQLQENRQRPRRGSPQPLLFARRHRPF